MRKRSIASWRCSLKIPRKGLRPPERRRKFRVKGCDIRRGSRKLRVTGCSHRRGSRKIRVKGCGFRRGIWMLLKRFVIGYLVGRG